MGVGTGVSIVVVLLGVGNSVIWGSAIGTAPESVAITKVTEMAMRDFMMMGCWFFFFGGEGMGGEVKVSEGLF